MKSKLVSIDFDKIKKNWCEDDYYRLFYNTLNTGIPAFERYVIKAVMESRKNPKLENEPYLKELMETFIAQEKQHTKLHRHINKKLGLDKLKTISKTEKIARAIQQNSTQNINLASSAFLEFVGFGFIKDHIDHNAFYDYEMNSEIAKLWKWHLAEELEHGFVKLKVLNYLDNSYTTKALGMAQAIVVSHFYVIFLIPEVVWEDAKMINKPFLPHFFKFMKNVSKTDWGINRESLRNYFSKNFDPETHVKWKLEAIEKWVKETKAA